ncbi:cysteine/O-acetylserine transporter [Escherichia coli]|uniref:cysteine/O-acetylserine transporter n=1 Tax=Escherichia coli TaxID=562 RepID=UPI001EFB71D2|nr:cysteine/O-acetylserine transporter [Escherichia coli]MCG8298692.1 cysteine/O-acetylserine transporter [Escherichia coli]MCG8303823.1 cysteine/O-acetylserine transporter [Escherichia coli]HDV4951070.1 cysteine/O-acetylserine transporter [Escherichia coli]
MTPTLLSAFWTYTLITAMTPGPNNILALSSATSHGFRQSTRVLAGMSLGFLIVMLLCAGISFSLAVIDPAAVHLLSWAGAAYIVWLAWKIATSPTKEDGLQAKPISFWASFALQFVNVKIILYGVTALSTFVLPQTQALSWVVGVSVLLAIIGTFGNVCWALAGHLFQQLFRQYGRQLNIVLALLLVYCAVRIFY